MLSPLRALLLRALGAGKSAQATRKSQPVFASAGGERQVRLGVPGQGQAKGHLR